MFNISVNDKKNIYRSKPVMNVDTTGSSGGSIPKPLTYDYMPEGYPSKSVETVTLMEEQEVTFADMGGGEYGATAPEKIDISDGQTYTVVWDGVEYSCVGHVIKSANYIGNPAAFGAESTGEPFLYANVNSQSMWASYDTSTSHTICVIMQSVDYQTIDEKYLPESVFTDADWDFVSNKPFFNKPLNVNITAENITQNINAGSNHINLGVTAPSFNEGLYYKVEGEVSFLNNSANQTHTLQINKYCEADSSGMISLGTFYDGYIRDEVVVGFCGDNYSVFRGNLYIRGAASASYTITANFIIISELKKLLEDYIPNIVQRVGDDVIIPSSTADSTKKFKITVDDSGTISATEVT